jgi:hypothetical protein
MVQTLEELLQVDAVTHCLRHRLGESIIPQTTPSKLRNVGYRNDGQAFPPFAGESRMA